MVKKSRRGKPNSTKVIDIEASEVDVAKDGVEILESNSEVSETSGVSQETTDVEEQVDMNGEEISETVQDKPVKKTSSVTLAGMLVSAVLGGGIALGGAGALNQAGFLKYVPFASGLVYGGDKTSANEELVAGLQAKIADLNVKIGNLSNATAEPSVIPDSLIERLAALESAVKSIDANASNAANANNANVDLSKITGDVAAANETAQAANDQAKDALAKVSELGQKIIAGTGGADEAMIKAALASESKLLSDKISMIEAKLVQTTELAGQSAGDTKLAEELNAKIEELAIKQTGLSEQFARVDDAEAQLESLSSQMESVNQRIDGEILAPMAEVKAAASAALAGQKIAKLTSARALSSALEQGGPFVGELASAEALIGSGPLFDELAPIAKTGVQTSAQLAKSFSPIYAAISKTQSTPAADASILDKFLSNAKSIVTVRPAGSRQGSDAVSIASRIAEALKNGDLSQSKNEWDSLPDTAKAQSGDWVNQLQNSLTAKGLVAKLVEALTQENKG